MYIYISIYIYISVYIYIHMSIYMYMKISTHIYTYLYIYLCMCICDSAQGLGPTTRRRLRRWSGGGVLLRGEHARSEERFCLTEIVYQVVLQKSFPVQIRQLILYINPSTYP